MKRILLIADAHYSEGSEKEEEKWFPAKIRKMHKNKIKDYLNFWDNLTQRKFQKLLRKAKLQEPFDFIIDIGDGTPGTNQQGLITEKAQQERQEYDKLIANTFPEKQVFSLWGNHDIGYPDTVIQEKVNGRMSKESFDKAKNLIGNPWLSKTIEDFTLLFLNSEIIRSSKENENPDQEFFVEKTKEQEKFTQECLKNANNKVILLIHDSIQFIHLQKILSPYKEKIVLVLAGHVHVLTAWKIYCILSRAVKVMQSFNVNLPTFLKDLALMQTVIQSFNIKIIPSSWGWSLPQKLIIGRGGFATMEINDKQVILKYHKI